MGESVFRALLRKLLFSGSAKRGGLEPSTTPNLCLGGGEGCWSRVERTSNNKTLSNLFISLSGKLLPEFSRLFTFSEL